MRWAIVMIFVLCLSNCSVHNACPNVGISISYSTARFGTRGRSIMPKGEEVEKENKPPRRRPKGDAVARAKAKAKAKAKAAAAKPDEPEESKPNKRAKR